MAGGQTGTDPDKSRGWMDWPSIRVSNAVNTPTTIPQRGFNRIIRVTYWINAENQFGAAVDPLNNRYYTLSVGYGPTPSGKVTRARRVGSITRPQALIALADGVYAGRQEDARLNGTDGVTNSRVGFRHRKGVDANTAFADGHAEPLRYTDFPRAPGTLLTLPQAQAENIGSFSLYANVTQIR
jgi:prepilin-type processing-associated H-X9-DG protein